MEMTISELFTTAAFFEENQENLDADMLFVLEKDVIDLEEAVSDNILLDLPLRVLTDEEKTSEILPTYRWGADTTMHCHRVGSQLLLRFTTVVLLLGTAGAEA